MIDIHVQVSGALFEGRSAAVLAAFIEDAKAKLAEQGVKDIQDRLYPGHGYRSGAYSRAIRTSLNIINDSNMIYGSWLEGTSRRNSSTRFKGYRTFRTVGQALQVKAVPLVEGLLPRYLGQLNGSA